MRGHFPAAACSFPPSMAGAASSAPEPPSWPAPVPAESGLFPEVPSGSPGLSAHRVREDAGLTCGLVFPASCALTAPLIHVISVALLPVSARAVLQPKNRPKTQHGHWFTTSLRNDF